MVRLGDLLLTLAYDIECLFLIRGHRVVVEFRMRCETPFHG